ncbi:ATP-binding protein [Lyngbya aestuarii]|uniref:ATP-binding protein n=1 Tax=Lyngbya aestuarii TaxID=118322 RepID=UPI00403DF18A
MSPNHLLIDSTIGRQKIDNHLLTLQLEMINQVAQVAQRRLVLEEVLPRIALHLQEALQVSGCFICRCDEHHQLLAFFPLNLTVPLEENTEVLPERDSQIDSLCRDLGQRYHCWLAQGKPLIFPSEAGHSLNQIQDLNAQNNLHAILMIPLLQEQSYFGAITLYNLDREREWTPQEVVFVQTIAAYCSLILQQTELEQHYQSELTKRCSTESQLQASIAKNRALLAVTPDLIFCVTRDGILLDWKAAKEDTLSIFTNEIINKHLHQVFPQEIAGLTWHHIELALETNKIQIIEYQLWLTGKSRNFEARIVKSGADQVAVIVQDVTERVQARVTLEQANDALEARVAERTAALREANHVLRAEIVERQKAEELLRQSEERFRNLVETSSDWVWEMDDAAVYTYASPKVSSLLGYEPSEILGKTPYQLTPAEETSRLAAIFADLLAERQPFSCLESTNLCKDGHPVIIESSGVPIFDPSGLFRGYHGITRDITKRKQEEQQVRFLHSITQALFESQDFYTALAVALQKVCEATGWDFGEAWVPRTDGSALECSPAWFSKSENLQEFRSSSEKFNFPPGVGLPGRVWVSKQPEWRRDVSVESIQIYRRVQVAQQAGLKAALGIPLLANDSVLAVLVFYMFESQNEDQRLIELISASTELGFMIQRKQAEGEIRKALEKEKELTELKSRFITMTSHEFRTPLTTIQSSAELLEHYSHKWTEEKKVTHLHRIQKSVNHMTKLLNDVLILGKAEAGKLQLNPVPLKLEEFCCDLVEELQLNNISQHNITFTYSQGISKNLLVEKDQKIASFPVVNSSIKPSLDEKILRQILENLLNNAIKYSPGGGTVKLILSYQQSQAVFRVSDQGIGIPPEEQQFLFEAFHRANNVGTITGTGLGLAIVKKCVDIHEGKISVESAIGVGTTFTVTLPIYEWLSTNEENNQENFSD